MLLSPEQRVDFTVASLRRAGKGKSEYGFVGRFFLQTELAFLRVFVESEPPYLSPILFSRFIYNLSSASKFCCWSFLDEEKKSWGMV